MRPKHLFAATICLGLSGLGLHTACGQEAKFPTFQPETAVAPNAFPGESVSQPLKSGFPQAAEKEEQTAAPVESIEGVGTLLQSLKLEPTLRDGQLDVLFEAQLDRQAVEVYYTVSLSENLKTVKVCAWLDPLPQGRIPADHLLELLTSNREVSQDCHFGFSRSVQRFLLETTLENQNLTAAQLETTMTELAEVVTRTWAVWATSEWKTEPDRVTRKPEFDSRSNNVPDEAFEMPVLR
ncbi:MAG: hypothetical protein KDA78_14710 [Planctomycetaceae bacterium]|nr:hypothetical protein [Planctomycetaceae bacterium]